MVDKTRAKKILTASLLTLEEITTPPGRPAIPTTWKKTIQQDLKSNNLSPNKAIDMARVTLETGVYIWH